MTGKLVFSKAGHDRNRAYIVVDEDNERVWLADGVDRGILNPKKKNRKHVQPAGCVFSEKDLASFREKPAWGNEMIREQCSKYVRKEA